jgi:hypothetical protein
MCRAYPLAVTIPEYVTIIIRSEKAVKLILKIQPFI